MPLRGVDVIYSLAFSPDGKQLALGSLYSLVRLWNLTDAEPEERVVLKGHEGSVGTLAFAPDGKVLASGSRDSTVRLWDPSVQKAAPPKTVLEGHKGEVTGVAYSPDGKTLVSGSGEETVRFWDLSQAEPKERAVCKGHKDGVRAVVFAPTARPWPSAAWTATFTCGTWPAPSRRNAPSSRATPWR